MHDIPADDLNALADRLRGWQPSTTGLDRDRLLFEAGRAAGLAEARASFRRRLWPIAMATAASLLLAFGFFVTRGSERSGETGRIAMTETPQQPPPAVESLPAPPVDPNSYLALSRRVAKGSFDPVRSATSRADSSPPSPAAPPLPLRARDLDRLLNL